MARRISYNLARLSVAAGVLIAFTSGLSLFWWRNVGQPEWLFSVIGPLISGSLLANHQLVGLIAGCVVLIGCLFLMITSTRSLPGNLLTLFVAVATLSGLALQVDLFTGGITVVIHRFSSWGTVLFGTWWLVSSIRSNKIRVQTITRGRLIGWSIATLTVIVFMVVPGAYWLTTPDTLHARYYEYDSIRVDGLGYDSAWRVGGYVELPAYGGSLFDHGTTSLRIWAVRQAFDVYLLIRWADDNPSTNRWLEKTDSGWIELHTENPGSFGERIWWEDNLAISIGNSPDGCMSTCHVTPNSDQAGYHATDGDTVDVWRWYAIRSTPVAQIEDGWWASKDSAGRSMHVDNRAGGGYTSNLNTGWMQPYLVPSYAGGLPWIHVASPFVSAYFHETDLFKVGHKVPALIVAPSQGDVNDVEVRARWESGFWTVEMRRRISTNSPFDVRMTHRDTVYLSVALFNNAEKHHAMVLRPIKLTVDPLPD